MTELDHSLARISEAFPGPRSFETKQAKWFHGRTRESRDLKALLLTYPAVTLFSRSGLGKTSLIKAGLRPALEAYHKEANLECRVEVVRVGGHDKKEEDQTVLSDNIFVANVLADLQVDQKSKRRFQSLSDYFLSQYTSGVLLLVFDQLEELFTTHPGSWASRKSFFEQISDLLQEYSRIERRQGPNTREQVMELHVLFSIREEFLAELDSYSELLPGGFRIRYRLEGLRKAPAIDAIELPARDCGFEFLPQASEHLIANLLRVPVVTDSETTYKEGEFLEPLHLQVLCLDLLGQVARRSAPASDLPIEPEMPFDLRVGLVDNPSVKRRKQKDDPPNTITVRDVEHIGGIDKVLSRYYERSIKLAAATRYASERKIRKWFDKYMITSAGTRSTVYQDKGSTGNLPNRVVCILEGERLVRKEKRAGADWVELVHDRLVAPIQDSNRAAARKHNLWLLRIGSSVVSALMIALIVLTGYLQRLRQQRQDRDKIATTQMSDIARVLPDVVTALKLVPPGVMDDAANKRFQGSIRELDRLRVQADHADEYLRNNLQPVTQSVISDQTRPLGWLYLGLVAPDKESWVGGSPAVDKPYAALKKGESFSLKHDILLYDHPDNKNSTGGVIGVLQSPMQLEIVEIDDRLGLGGGYFCWVRIQPRAVAHAESMK